MVTFWKWYNILKLTKTTYRPVRESLALFAISDSIWRNPMQADKLPLAEIYPALELECVRGYILFSVAYLG